MLSSTYIICSHTLSSLLSSFPHHHPPKYCTIHTHISPRCNVWHGTTQHGLLFINTCSALFAFHPSHPISSKTPCFSHIQTKERSRSNAHSLPPSPNIRNLERQIAWTQIKTLEKPSTNVYSSAFDVAFHRWKPYSGIITKTKKSTVVIQ